MFGRKTQSVQHTCLLDTPKRMTAQWLTKQPVLIFFFVFSVHGYFYNGASWNQNARFDPIYSFVEPGHSEYLSFKIDRFITDPERGRNTGDWAFHEGHYYSNKAPGLTFWAIPLYFALYHAESFFGANLMDPKIVQFNAYAINLWSSVLFTALAAAFFCWFLSKREADESEGCQYPIFFTLLLSFGTLIFPFATQFWGHSTAASLLLISFLLLQDSRPKTDLLAGFILGFAVCVEYMAGIALPFWGIYILWSRKNCRTPLLWLALGGFVWAAALLGYHKMCFDSFFTPASQFSNPVFTEKALTAGQFGGFSWGRLWFVLFSWKRGIFVYMPFLIVSLWQGIRCFYQKRKPETALSLAMIFATIFVISCFIGQGGASSGSRYLIVTLPFFILLSKVPDQQILKIVFYALSAVSFANMLVISAVNPMLSLQYTNPWWDQLYKRFLTGDFPTKTWLSYFSHQPSREELALSTWNFGNLLGLEGLWSLLPLLLIVLVFGWLLLKSDKISKAPR